MLGKRALWISPSRPSRSTARVRTAAATRRRCSAARPPADARSGIKIRQRALSLQRQRPTVDRLPGLSKAKTSARSPRTNKRLGSDSSESAAATKRAVSSQLVQSIGTWPSP